MFGGEWWLVAPLRKPNVNDVASGRIAEAASALRCAKRVVAALILEK